MNKENLNGIKVPGVNEREVRESKYQCPICGVKLVMVQGGQMSSDLGITVYCANRQCSAQEVFGFSRDGKEVNAYEVIVQKYKI